MQKLILVVLGMYFLSKGISGLIDGCVDSLGGRATSSNSMVYKNDKPILFFVTVFVYLGVAAFLIIWPFYKRNADESE
ncbi:hypothetical protein [Thalassotalea agariperforans]